MGLFGWLFGSDDEEVRVEEYKDIPPEVDNLKGLRDDLIERGASVDCIIYLDGYIEDVENGIERGCIRQ